MARWIETYLTAWTELGRPDLKYSPLLPTIDLDFPVGRLDDSVWQATASTAAKHVLALITHPFTTERAHWLLEQVPTLEDPAPFIVTASVLSDEAAPEALQRKAVPVLLQRLSALTTSHPRSLQLHLLRFLLGTSPDEPFAPEALSELEALTALPVWRETSTLALFHEARRHLAYAGVACAGLGASTLAMHAAVGQGPRLLNKRAKATRSQLLPNSRHALGRALSRIGERLVEGPTLLEHLLGLGLMHDGAEDLQDASALERIDARRDACFEDQDAWRRAAPFRWPLASFLEEQWEATAQDERAWLHTFQGPSSGTSDAPLLFEDETASRCPPACP